MQWFKHDTTATSDAKIRKLIIRYGAVGYAIYFHCLELIACDTSEANLTFELEHDSEIIADNLKIKGTANQSAIEVVEEIMRFCIDLNLFDEKDSRVFCFKLLKRLDTSMTSNPKMRQMIQSAKQNHDAVMIGSCSGHDTIMQEEPEEPEEPKEPKEIKTVSRFTPPTYEEVDLYCQERNNSIDCEKFVDFYTSKNWMVGKTKMKDWRACVRTWEKSEKSNGSANKTISEQLDELDGGRHGVAKEVDRSKSKIVDVTPAGFLSES